MKDQIIKQIEQHNQKFNYKLSEKQKFEILTLYDLNNDTHDETSLSLFIEQYVSRNQNEQNDEWMLHRRQSVSAKLLVPEEFNLPEFEKDDETFKFLISKLSGRLPFDMISLDQKITLVRSMQSRIVEEGSVFIQQGDKGCHMYIIQTGEFDVFVDGVFTNKLYPGTVFGEVALLHEIPRTATVIASKRSIVWGAEQTSFTFIRVRDIAFKKTLVHEALVIYLNEAKASLDQFAISDAQENVELRYFTEGTSVALRDDEIVIFFKDCTILDGKDEVKIKPGQVTNKSFVALTACDCGILNLKSIKIL